MENNHTIYGHCSHGNRMGDCDECDKMFDWDKPSIQPKAIINPYVYFVEMKSGHGWIPEKGEEETFNPAAAKQFNTIQEADKYIKDNDLGEFYHSTEHEFFSTLP